MSNLYAVHAFEQIFAGLHGIESYSVIEAINEEEAEEYAREESYDIITSYPDVYNDLENYVRESFDFNDKEVDYEDFDNELEEAYKEDIDYEIFLLKETSESLEALDRKYQKDPEGFIEKYAENESF